MKTMASILCILFSLQSFAAPAPDDVKALIETQSDCSQFIKYDDTSVYIGFSWALRVLPLDRSAAFDLQTDAAALDVIAIGDALFVLTPSGLQEWSLASRTRTSVYATNDAGRELAYKEHATAFARLDDTLIIAHGRLGISFFDLKTRKLVKQTRLVPNQKPHESMATGVTIWDNTAYVVMDNFTLGEYNGKFAFRGVIKVDMPSQAVVKELVGLDPGADAIVTDGKTLIVSYGGNPVWKYNLKTFGGEKMPRPSGIIPRWHIGGHPTRLPFMDDKYYYTCFFKRPEGGGSWPKVPAVLDRETYLLK